MTNRIQTRRVCVRERGGQVMKDRTVWDCRRCGRVVALIKGGGWTDMVNDTCSGSRVGYVGGKHDWVKRKDG